MTSVAALRLERLKQIEARATERVVRARGLWPDEAIEGAEKDRDALTYAIGFIEGVLRRPTPTGPT